VPFAAAMILKTKGSLRMYADSMSGCERAPYLDGRRVIGQNHPENRE